MRPLVRLVSCLSLMGLCWGCQGGPGEDSSTTPTSSTDTGATETGEPEDDGHGSVYIEISPLAGDESIFDGTTAVVATVQYESCLQDFYLLSNPDLQQQGNAGAPIFASWHDKLCSDFTDVPSCSVAGIQQTLIEANAVYNLSVTFTIDDPSTLAYGELHVGPLPTELLAACEGGLRPRVELLQSGLLGRDGNGNQIWRIATLPASNVAVTDQGVPLRVEVVRIDP